MNLTIKCRITTDNSNNKQVTKPITFLCPLKLIFESNRFK